MNPRYLFYRFKYRYAKQLNLTAPVDVSLELTSYCNQACSYCYHADQKKLPFVKGFMNTELAVKVIHESAAIGVNSLKFNYRGESTLHPSFEYLTSTAKNFASGSTFIDRLTNSNFKFSTADDSIFRGLLNQTKVKVSLDSFIPGVMHKQRAGSQLELAIKNIDRFYNWPGRKTELVIQAVRTQLNKDEDIAHEVYRRWPQAKCNVNDMVGGRVGKDLSKLELKKRDASERQSCLQANARLIIRWDGGVQACCPSIKGEITLGDANKQTVLDLWNGEPAKQLRASLKDRTAFLSEPCKSCSSFESYRGWAPRWES